MYPRRHRALQLHVTVARGDSVSTKRGGRNVRTGLQSAAAARVQAVAADGGESLRGTGPCADSQRNIDAAVGSSG